MASLSAHTDAVPERLSARGCPSDDELLAFIPGLLADEEASVVSAHLQSCSTCQSRVTTLKKKISTDHGKAPAASGDAEIRTPATAAQPSKGAPTDLGDRAAVTIDYNPQRRRVPTELGNYQLLHPIGRGGMGVVYKAYHSRLQRHYAIKLLPGLHLGDDTAIVRLQREMAAAGRVEHEHIVYSSDAGTQDGIDYLVMEYVEGVDLARLVVACDPLPIADACEIIRQAALGLAHIEACGLVHRDIKPSNLMLSTEGVVKILDLGLARLRESPIDEAEATHTGFLLGTADYISPEQIDRPRAADVRSDLYSLGCAMYKLLAGRAPFSDEQHSNVTSKIDAHRREPAPPIRTLRPEVPEALDQLLARLLAKNPADRLQHPDEVAAALAPLAAGSNLRALACRATPPAASEQPLASASPTPSAIHSSTRPQSRTPTPRGVATSPSSRPWLAIAGAAALSAAALWAVGPWIWNSLHGGAASTTASPASQPDAAPAVVTKAGNSLLAAATPLELPDNHAIQTINVDEPHQMIQLVSEEIQLVKLGVLEPGRSQLSLELHVAANNGDAGVFFGYREHVDGSRRWSEAHFIHFQMLPAAKIKPFVFVREQAELLPGNNALVSLVARREQLDPRPSQRFKLAISFAPAGIEAITLDDQPFPALLTTTYSQKFDPQAIWGPWGLFNHGSTIRVFQPTLIQEPPHAADDSQSSSHDLRTQLR